MSVSIGTSLYTTVAAFEAIGAIIGRDRAHGPVKPEQVAWLEEVYERCAPEIAQIPEIASNATLDPKNHVAFLSKHGWQSQITDTAPNDILTAGVLDVLVHWLETGRQTRLKVDGVGEFPAARVKGGVRIERKESGEVVVTLSTRTPDEILIALADHAPADTRELNRMTAAVFGGKRKHEYDYDGVIFPMVDLQSRQSLDWLVGLMTMARGSARSFCVAQALQQATLKMNHEGARARAADEMVTRCLSVDEPPFKVDRPFLVAFTRPGLSHYLFQAYVSYDAWKDPGGLGV